MTPMRSDENLAHRLKELNEIGIALSRQGDLDHLLETILLAAKRVANADAGTLYLHDPEQRVLRFAILRTDSLKVAMGGTSGVPIRFDPISLYDKEGRPDHKMVVTHAALSGETVNLPDAYAAEEYDFSGTKSFDAKNGYRSTSFLTVPMLNHEDEVIGVLQLINAQDPQSGGIVPFDEDHQHLLESLASQAAIVLTNRRLIEQLEELFESLVVLINTAIDDKSPYTGGHCARVPALTMMLAEAAGADMTDAQRHELKIAALLHDCGKITTPVDIVDKATKLQTIFDRIHLLDTRFEVLKRDAEIELLRALAAGGGEASLRAAYEARLRQLEDDRAFLRRCNVGGEFMAEEDCARVRRIAAYRWRGADGRTADFLSEDEVKNLTIRAGTLTEEERRIINRHIEVSIKMLESLPWPKQLKNVPEFAGGHHERMDGKGYPKGLTREQMSVQARMIGIADIFEALTAADRPYKKGKTLSEALEILGKMKLGGHIDPDLFDVFVREKVYLAYAKQFLPPAQIDAVDESRIPGYTPKAG